MGYLRASWDSRATVAYPINVWLVSKGLKHGLMTERPHHATSARHEHGSIGAVHAPSAFQVTRLQLAALCGISAFALALGMVAPANW